MSNSFSPENLTSEQIKAILEFANQVRLRRIRVANNLNSETQYFRDLADVFEEALFLGLPHQFILENFARIGAEAEMASNSEKPRDQDGINLSETMTYWQNVLRTNPNAGLYQTELDGLRKQLNGSTEEWETKRKEFHWFVGKPLQDPMWRKKNTVVLAM